MTVAGCSFLVNVAGVGCPPREHSLPGALCLVRSGLRGRPRLGVHVDDLTTGLYDCQSPCWRSAPERACGSVWSLRFGRRARASREVSGRARASTEVSGRARASREVSGRAPRPGRFRGVPVRSGRLQLLFSWGKGPDARALAVGCCGPRRPSCLSPGAEQPQEGDKLAERRGSVRDRASL